MRTYGQYCALAKALDVVGHRWTLLIVRELLLRGPSRYTDLRSGLPGIATNLLVARLREMERAGIVLRETQAPPIAATVFRLTRRGEDLEPVLHQLGRWGGPLMAARRRDDVFRSHWLCFPARVHLQDHSPDDPPIAIEVRTGDEPLVIEAVGGTVRMQPGSVPNPDAVLAGRPELVVGLLTGKLDLAAARQAGVRYDGDPRALGRVQPRALAAA